ncbi:MAG: disulfide bond formation protein B, partial [Paucibacter sp.]|nr:disulfide bond formation protein B [Roseateles sp.]
RGICLLVALVAGLGWLLRGVQPMRQLALALVLVLSLAGLAAAYYQWDVASQLASCDLTLADRIITALKLESRLPYVFMVTASCADADLYHLLGLPYEAWSGLLYLGLGALSLYTLSRNGHKAHRH